LNIIIHFFKQEDETITKDKKQFEESSPEESAVIQESSEYEESPGMS
jgi:hypothetical protein